MGYYGTQLGVNVTQLRYELDGGGANLNVLQPTGEGYLYSMLAVHPVVRRRDLNVFAQLTVEQKNLEDRTIATFEEREIRSRRGERGEVVKEVAEESDTRLRGGKKMHRRWSVFQRRSDII